MWERIKGKKAGNLCQKHLLSNWGSFRKVQKKEIRRVRSQISLDCVEFNSCILSRSIAFLELLFCFPPASLVFTKE